MVRNYPLDYLEWLKNQVRHPIYDPWKYNKLFLYLSMTPFRWSLELDEDRAADGKRLRYRFGEENLIPSKAIERNLDISPCSVLEMLIGMAIRFSECTTIGLIGFETTGDIFWTMIENLLIDGDTDESFREKDVKRYLDLFMDRKFDRVGWHANIIHIADLDPKKDLRTIPFYTQVQLYITSINKIYDKISSYGI